TVARPSRPIQRLRARYVGARARYGDYASGRRAPVIATHLGRDRRITGREPHVANKAPNQSGSPGKQQTRETNQSRRVCAESITAACPYWESILLRPAT